MSGSEEEDYENMELPPDLKAMLDKQAPRKRSAEVIRHPNAVRRHRDGPVKPKGGFVGSVHFADMDKENRPKATVPNARTAILALGITCRYDIFHDKLLVGGLALAPLVSEFSDNACLM